MNKVRLFKKSIIAAAVTLASQQAIAAGFQLNAQSATGLGRAFSGDAVIADNASSMARNPATMALFDETAMSLGLVSITSMIEVKDAKYNGTFDANYDDAGSTSFVPNIHLIVPVDDKFAWGVNVYSNFGTKTEFSNSYVAGEFAGLTDVQSINLGVAASYRINDQLSLGGGLDIIYGSGKFERTFTSSGTPAVKIDADGWAFGFNLGAVYELNENNRFGLAYHYSPELEADGDVYYAGNPFTDGKDTLLIPLPDMIEFSGYHHIENTKFAVHYSIQWIGWSTFDVLEGKETGVINSYEWQDGMHFSLGGTYYLDKNWTIRAGYMHDSSAQDKLTSISVPDSDRNWLSAGFTYNISEKANIDFGLTYLLGDKVDVQEKSLAGTVISATTDTDAVLVGLQYSRTF